MLGLKAIGAVAGKIFGGGETIRAGMELIEKMHTSTAEQIQAANDARIRLLEAYQGYKVTQRLIAVMFCFTYLLSFFIVLVMTLRAPGVTTKDILEVVQVFRIDWATMLILVFYFGGGAFEGGAAAMRKRLQPAAPKQD